MTIELSDGGSVRLAVPAGNATRGTALARIFALRGSPGWIAGSSVHEWHFDGVTERDGTLYLVGPRASGLSLQEALEKASEAGFAEALALVSRLARALLQLSRSPAGWFPLQSSSVVFLEDGDVLFLPPVVDKELREMRPFEANRETFECLAHPDLTGEPRTVFAVAVALYRIFTGRFPFHAEDPEVLHAQARSLEIQPPSLLVPGLDAEVSEMVMAGLRRGRRGTVTLAQLAQALETWKARELVHPPATEEEKRGAREAAEARKVSADRSFRRRRFWQRNWRVVAIIAAALIVVGSLAGTVLKNVLAPRMTRGLSPAGVVEAFYASMNSLDHTTMEACVIGTAGSQEINEAMTLYVTSRVTLGYEGRSGVMSAADWDKSGRPLIAPPATLYGVTGLSLSREQGEPLPVFLVTYQKWNPAPRPESDAAFETPPLSEGHAVTDRVWLKRDRGDWVIYRIDRLQSVELPPPGSR